VSKLISESEDVDREVVFEGTDSGLVTMATTVRLPIDRYHGKIDVYNYFSVLANKSEWMQVKCFRITAGEINQRALARKHGKKVATSEKNDLQRYRQLKNV
jgi:hypothetical protein